jgi:hypothetical protein
MVKMVWGEDQVPIYPCTWHVLKAWCLHLMEKIENNEVKCAILDDLHIVMYMSIELNESIETFMNHGKNKVIKSFTQHLPNDL